MSVKLKLTGFDDLLNDIQKAGGSMNAATKNCMKKSASIMENSLKEQMSKANVNSKLIDKMPSYETEEDHDRFTARVGYKKGAYDPKNPSDGYKVVFLNYGTPYRSKHGKVKARGFIQKAKSKAKRKIKDEQEKTLKEILKGLQK